MFAHIVIWESIYKVRVAETDICTITTVYRSVFTGSTGAFLKLRIVYHLYL